MSALEQTRGRGAKETDGGVVVTHPMKQVKLVIRDVVQVFPATGQSDHTYLENGPQQRQNLPLSVRSLLKDTQEKRTRAGIINQSSKPGDGPFLK
jgi:hypothetical protein